MIFFRKNCIILLAALSTFAQTAQDNKTIPQPQPIAAPGNRTITIGTYTIENCTVSAPGKLSPITNSNRELLWRSFMHGITDTQATPVSWQSLDATQEFATALDAGAQISNLLKKSTLPALCLKGRESISFKSPFISAEKLYPLRGKTLRVFIWIKAENAGVNTHLWLGAPNLRFTFRQNNGTPLAVVDSNFKTRGTFPWFCYHIDLQIPANLDKPQAVTVSESKNNEEEEDENSEEITLTLDEAEEPKFVFNTPGLYITLTNPTSGIAWFSTPSYQIIPADTSLFHLEAREQFLDPKTNSLAPNPDYDELPMHLFYGISPKASWNFLKGNKVMADLTQKDNLITYFNHYQSDWAHSLYAIPFLASLYNNGKLQNRMKDFEAGWDETLLQLLQKSQNPQTGFWSIDKTPNLFITNAIISNSFHPNEIQHCDRAPQATPWLTIQNTPLKQSDAIITTLLAARRKGTNGKTAAWNNFTFQASQEDAKQQTSECDMPATAAALSILRQAQATASPDLQKKAEAALEELQSYILEKMFLSNNLWIDSAYEGTPSASTAIFSALAHTRWAEFRINDALKQVKASAELDEDDILSINWSPKTHLVALRIFAASEEIEPSQLTEAHLLFVIQKQNALIKAMDPIAALKLLEEHSQTYYGINSTRWNAPYLASKLANLSPNFKIVTQTGKQKLKLTRGKTPLKIFVAAVATNGAMTPPYALDTTLPASEEAETSDTEEGEKEKETL